MATVLIGENVPDIRDMLTRLFDRAGHQVRTCVDGDAVLCGALNVPPDLVVMNPSLPGISGLDVCRRLRADPRTTRLPIMMISVRQYPADLTAARTAGADDYVGKPFDHVDLMSRAESLLARHSA